MRILIVDDQETRHKKIQSLVMDYFDKPVSIWSAYTVKSAIKFLKQEEFDVIFLDHDLGENIYQDSNELDTGYQIAKFIIAAGINTKEIIVHSMNYPGAMNILDILPQAKYIPFINLESAMLSLNTSSPAEKNKTCKNS
ncbi:MAG: hypothetical protein Q7R95_11515, partial [bacterium]|nr:hypothetical protein [bacterium]